MKDSKLSKRLDRLIIFLFAFFITVGIVINIYHIVNESQMKYVIDENYNNVNWIPVFVSSLFLGVYILGRKFYGEHLDFLPPLYYYITMLFAVCSVYLGSYLDFYEAISWWDTMLHFVSGILLGLISIIIVSFVVKSRFGKFSDNKDILFLVIVGVLVSISIAVFWEFYEYSFDYLADGNMQRSIIVDDPSTYDFSSHIRKSGRFIDPGLKDTMKDQFLAVAGAVIAGIYSYYHFYAIQLNIKK